MAYTLLGAGLVIFGFRQWREHHASFELALAAVGLQVAGLVLIAAAWST